MATFSETLLTGPAPPNCTSERIDFSKTVLKEYTDSFAVWIHNLLTPEECIALLQAAEQQTNGKWELAMINVGNGRQRLATDVRNCGRIIWDNPDVAARIQDRIMAHLPADIVHLKERPRVTGMGPIKRKETWRLTRLNERLRFLKYTSGMYFREHCDGSYVTPDGSEVSFLTVHLYLNGTPDDATPDDESSNNLKRSEEDLPLVGGATRFFAMKSDAYLDVTPSTGACLVFQHRNLFHSGDDVLQGTKYTVRTDIMYTVESRG